MDNKALAALLSQMESRSYLDTTRSRSSRYSRRKAQSSSSEPKAKVHYTEYKEKKLGHRETLKKAARISRAVRELVELQEISEISVMERLEKVEAEMDSHTKRFIRIESDSENSEDNPLDPGEKTNKDAHKKGALDAEGAGNQNEKKRRRWLDVARERKRKRASVKGKTPSKLTDASFNPAAISLFSLDDLPDAPRRKRVLSVPPDPQQLPDLAGVVSEECDESLSFVEDLLEVVNIDDLIEEEIGQQEMWETVHDLKFSDDSPQIATCDIMGFSDVQSVSVTPVYAEDEFLSKNIDDTFLKLINDDAIELDSVMAFTSLDLTNYSKFSQDQPFDNCQLPSFTP